MRIAVITPVAGLTTAVAVAPMPVVSAALRSILTAPGTNWLLPPAVIGMLVTPEPVGASSGVLTVTFWPAVSMVAPSYM